jgi:hypothetical protein
VRDINADTPKQHGAPENEYDSEIEDFAALKAAGMPITPKVVARVWHKWFGIAKG